MTEGNPEPLVPASLPPWVSSLNDRQREAVTHTEGPVLVTAGAGTGKTSVLTTRLAWLLHEEKAPPWRLLCVTFTNKAAKEMRERLEKMVPMETVRSLWMGTFHGLSMRMLQRSPENVGLEPDFGVMSSGDQLLLMDRVVDEFKMKKICHPRNLLSEIERWKNRALFPDDVTLEDFSQHDLQDRHAYKIVDIYRAYQARLQEMNFVDFGDLILYALRLIQSDADLRHRFKYILVDEYQDTNHAQYLWLKALAEGSGNLCCVGDEDQSIYGWRGAEIANILSFEKDFPRVQYIPLEENYRSHQTILDAASGLIAQNKRRRKKKALRSGLPSRSGGGEKIKIHETPSEAEQSWELANTILAYQRQGDALSSMGILVRAHYMMKPIVREFRNRTPPIPYLVYGNRRLLERAVVQTMLAYLRLVRRSSDDPAFERAVNQPPRGVGKVTVQALRDRKHAEESLFDCARRSLSAGLISGRARAGLQVFVDLILEKRTRLEALTEGRAGAPPSSSSSLQPVSPLAELTREILEDSGLVLHYRSSKAPDAPGHLDHLQDFITSLDEDEEEDLGTYLDQVALMENVAQGKNGAPKNHVSLMTMHAAKGLEFDNIFLPCWTERRFPGSRTLEAKDREKALEEERRLAYVALTRARRRISIFCSSTIQTFKGSSEYYVSRSCFINDIPEHLRVHSQTRAPVGTSGEQPGNSSRQDAGHHAGNNSGDSGQTAGSADSMEKKQLPPVWKLGMRVSSDQFGEGTITGSSVEGRLFRVRFEDGQARTILASYLREVPAGRHAPGASGGPGASGRGPS